MNTPLPNYYILNKLIAAAETTYELIVNRAEDGSFHVLVTDRNGDKVTAYNCDKDGHVLSIEGEQQP